MFVTQDNIYIIEKCEGESNKYYYTKCLFMSFINNIDDFEYYLKYANIYCNKIIHDVEYDNKTNIKLQNIIEKFKIKI